jgi:hypothetical protein
MITIRRLVFHWLLIRMPATVRLHAHGTDESLRPVGTGGSDVQAHEDPVEDIANMFGNPDGPASSSNPASIVRFTKPNFDRPASEVVYNSLII